MALLDAFSAPPGAHSTGEPIDERWDRWLYGMYPAHVRGGFAPRHSDLWEWVDAIHLDTAPDPFVGIWPRGGGKSTSAELATAKLGLTARRRYVLYVRETQEQADKSVANVAALLESDTVERHYPAHAERMVGKFGESKGWRRNRLRTAGGFTVDALGLDTASRGVKVEDQRPDLIVLDDIDDKHDTAATTARKIATITTSILPAGATNVAVLAIQNLIIPDGVFTRLVDGRADFLARRIVSGPHPAVEGLTWDLVEDPESGAKRAVITGGTATWEGQSLTICQHTIDTIGLAAFLKEAQHEVTDRTEGLALRFDETRHLEDLTDERCRELVAMGQAFAGIDFGAWRFAFVFRAVDTGGVIHEVAEYFSQREELEPRAKAIHALLSYYDAPSGTRIYGDAANPQDIMELNRAFTRIESPYRVRAVAGENKIRKTAVDRMNDNLLRDALRYRRGVSTHVQQALSIQWKALEFDGSPPDVRTWRLGYNASSAGTAMEGSRLLYEVKHWGYPVPKEGEAQRQDPDDHTADGADLIAADRYALMSYWKPAREVEKPKPKDRNEDNRLEEMLEEIARRKREGGLDRSSKLTRETWR